MNMQNMKHEHMQIMNTCISSKFYLYMNAQNMKREHAQVMNERKPIHMQN